MTGKLLPVFLFPDFLLFLIPQTGNWILIAILYEVEFFLMNTTRQAHGSKIFRFLSSDFLLFFKRGFVFFSIFLLMSFFSGVSASEKSGIISLIRIEGPITPLTANYVERSLRLARENNSEILIIEMDTPGGLLDSTKKIVQDILDADAIPVVVYISPQGASAASAGTFITMAAHIAAMAPATNIGAASPVQMGGAQMDSVMQKKIFNYAESYIESIAEKRGRNAEWAIAAVKEGESITAEKAVELNVIDFIAANRTELLEKLQGRMVNGKSLQVINAELKTISPNLAERWLSILIRPEVILILTMLAIYGIVGEITNPGAIIPGVAGVIALILVLFASAAIPLNTAGFILILIAVGLFIAEAFTPTFGVLISGGAVAFFLGVLMLFQDLPESMSISFGWLIPATIVMVLFFIWVAFEGIRIQFRSASTGKNAMIGKTAKVIDRVSPAGGRVFVIGEYWNAVSDEIIEADQICKIIDVKNLTLKVEKILSNEEVS